MSDTMDALSSRMRQVRATTLLRTAPDLAAHILQHVLPSRQANGLGTPITGTTDPGAPLNLQALEDAEYLFAELVDCATFLARILGVAPPASALPYARKDVNCPGFPGWARETADRVELVRDVSRWLVAVADAIATHEADVARRYFDEVATIIGSRLARYPMVPRKQHVAARACPVCGYRTVIVDFDAREWDEDLQADSLVVVVACTFCGHVIPTAGVERFLER